MNSAIMKMEINCDTLMLRLMNIELMSGSMGSGNLVRNEKGDTWRQIPSSFHMIPALVCGK
jgi:hypothetical protein